MIYTAICAFLMAIILPSIVFAVTEPIDDLTRLGVLTFAISLGMIGALSGYGISRLAAL